MIYSNFVQSIGNTPLIKLRGPSEETQCNILGKAEYLNPGGSIKDRAAWAIIKEAEEKNEITKGGIIVEGTAGNTGIGLTLIGNSKGYKTIIIMPENQTKEKIDTLKSIGSDLRLVPPKPYKDNDNFVKISSRLAKELKPSVSSGVIWANQFDNLANYQAHYETTGPEIWKDTKGKIDGFVCSVGTGGTIAGIGSFLKKKNKKIKIGLVDPFGSALHNYYKNGELKSTGSSITEGIGQSRITENLKKAEIDESFQANDKDALRIVFNLLKEEGLVMGGSTGINIMGAIQLAKKLGPGSTIVTILCDYGTRYFSKIYNKRFLKSKKLPIPNWLK